MNSFHFSGVNTKQQLSRRCQFNGDKACFQFNHHRTSKSSLQNVPFNEEMKNAILIVWVIVSNGTCSYSHYIASADVATKPNNHGNNHLAAWMEKRPIDYFVCLALFQCARAIVMRNITSNIVPSIHTEFPAMVVERQSINEWQSLPARNVSSTKHKSGQIV